MTILQIKNFRTRITTNTRAFIYLGPHGSVAERIKHEASGMLIYGEKSQTLWEADSSLHSQPAVTIK